MGEVMDTDRSGQCVLGREIAAVIFEVDGVVVDSARASAGAWKSVFDPFLRSYAAVREVGFRPFEVRGDYLRYVHGRTPVEGARAFLASREISLANDELRRLAARQEALLRTEIGRYGVRPFASTVAAVRTARRRGIRTAAVSAQRLAVEMLRRAGVAQMFDVCLDGLDAPGATLSRPTHPGLPPAARGRGDPGLLLEAARRLEIIPSRTAVVGETPAGLAAARHGGFGSVIGVDRIGQADALREHGADLIVADLSELRVHGRPAA
jgi:beta-phosphoglucomutase-like phosphatase (HAD superfamily)